MKLNLFLSYVRLTILMIENCKGYRLKTKGGTLDIKSSLRQFDDF